MKFTAPPASNDINAPGGKALETEATRLFEKLVKVERVGLKCRAVHPLLSSRAFSLRKAVL